MAYTPNPTWKPGVAGGTIISAVSLNRIEQGLAGVSLDVDSISAQTSNNTSSINSVSTQLGALTTRVATVESKQASGSPGTGVAVAG